jgi:hypothetical protein
MRTAVPLSACLSWASAARRQQRGLPRSATESGRQSRKLRCLMICSPPSVSFASSNMVGTILTIYAQHWNASSRGIVAHAAPCATFLSLTLQRRWPGFALAGHSSRSSVVGRSRNGSKKFQCYPNTAISSLVQWFVSFCSALIF